MYPRIILREGRDYTARHYHPWIFSGAVERTDGHPRSGEIVHVTSSDGECVGTGHYYDGSIAVKLFAFSRVDPDMVFWREKIYRARQVRKDLGLIDNDDTDAFRLIYGESDGLPGLIVDLYGETAVLQFQGEGMQRLKDTFVLVLQEVVGRKLRNIYEKPLDKSEDAGEGQYLLGGRDVGVIIENGLRFKIDWEKGQKTGFFLDQRENRALLEKLSHRRNVLNCFSYSGAFSCYALRGGASHVISVDSSKEAEALLAENLTMNFEDSSRHEFVSADCMQYLHSLEGQYDLIVLDPPAFVKHRGALQGGMKGYETINYLALRYMAPGGLLFTFSCSQLVQRDIFLRMLTDAALRAKRSVRILYELHQAPCHPVNIFHPESEYLKGYVMLVE